MNVQELMTRSVMTCCPDDSLDRAARLMWENDIGSVPVLDDHGHPVAMLTDRDVCMAGYTQGRSLRDIPVKTAMSTSLHTVGPRDPLSVAGRRMQQHQVRRLPVIDDDGHLAGLISMSDIAREAQRGHPHRHRSVSSQDLAATLAAVCRPRVCAITEGPSAPAPLAASPAHAPLLLSATAQAGRLP